MIKGYVIGDFFQDRLIEMMKKAAEESGCSLTFYKNEQEAAGKVADGVFIYCRKADLIPEMPELKWCQTAFAGVDPYIQTGRFDSGEAILTNSSGAYGRTIAEHIIMVTLQLMRQMPEYQKIMNDHGWGGGLPMRSITGSRIAIIGAGNIGQNAAARFRAMGALSVTGFNRSGSTEGLLVSECGGESVKEIPARDYDWVDMEDRAPVFDQVYPLDRFNEKAGEIDVLVLCVPGTEETGGLLNEERIACLSENAYVINVGRGTAVDQEALTAALNEGRIAGAALDVTVPEPLPADHPLWTARNCIITPHIAGDMCLEYTVEASVTIFCENMKRFAAGEPLIKRVDPKLGY